MWLKRRASSSLLGGVKMPQCPKCRQGIDFLLFHVEVMGMLLEKGEIAYETEDMDDSVDFVKGFVCPECGEIVVTSKQEADHFLEAVHLEQKVLE